MEGKNSFNANPIRNLPNGEGRSNPPSFLTNDHPFEELYSFLLSLDDLHMDLYGIPHPEIREICPQLFSFNQFHRIHLLPPKNSTTLHVSSFMFQVLYFNLKLVSCNSELNPRFTMF